jgi:hypothetical protein
MATSGGRSPGESNFHFIGIKYQKVNKKYLKRFKESFNIRKFSH